MTSRLQVLQQLKDLGFASRSALPAAVFVLAATLALAPVERVPAAERDAATAAPAFVERPCELPMVPPVSLARLRCGTVEVPRIYGKSDSGAFRLAVTILRSARRPARPDPIVVLAGGPGGSITIPLAFAAADPGFGPAVERDMILIDPRGTGQSEPRLCSDVTGVASVAMIAPDSATQDFVAGIHAGMKRCFAEARELGLLPESFGTEVNADDVERIRQALSIERWNAFGSSYGTVTGMTLAARVPGRLRSLILDSVVLLDADDASYIDERIARSKRAFFSECATTPVCARNHPQLEADLERALDRLDVEPLNVPMPVALHLPGDRVILNRGDFELVMLIALYDRTTIGRLPAAIQAVNERRGDLLTPAVLAIGAQDAMMSLFPFIAVLCRDAAPDSKLLRAEPGKPVAAYHAQLPGGVCADWNASPVAPKIPVGTKVPTLVLAGALDPATPPADSRAAAKRIGPAAQFVEFPRLSHAATTHGCASGISVSFLADPSTPVDRSCAANIEPIDFN